LEVHGLSEEINAPDSGFWERKPQKLFTMVHSTLGV